MIYHLVSLAHTNEQVIKTIYDLISHRQWEDLEHFLDENSVDCFEAMAQTPFGGEINRCTRFVRNKAQGE